MHIFFLRELIIPRPGTLMRTLFSTTSLEEGNGATNKINQINAKKAKEIMSIQAQYA
jgi:hypothetical protein